MRCHRIFLAQCPRRTLRLFSLTPSPWFTSTDHDHSLNIARHRSAQDTRIHLLHYKGAFSSSMRYGSFWRP